RRLAWSSTPSRPGRWRSSRRSGPPRARRPAGEGLRSAGAPGSLWTVGTQPSTTHAGGGAARTVAPVTILVAPEVADALARRGPVVALESTIISHGLPRPDNLLVAEQVEETV